MASSSSIFTPTKKGADLKKRLLKFFDDFIYPNEAKFQEYFATTTGEARWTPPPILEELKVEARSQGLWNLFMPVETDGGRYGAGLSNLEYAPLAEIMGRVLWASEVFNCSAPDTGNMEVLARYGTEEQKRKWLNPLLEGKIRSCFGMTEPAVASSDATNMQAEMKRDGNEYVINGTKWWTSGAPDKRCKVCIFMCRSAHAGPRHAQHSMILVPMDAPGVHIKRALTVFGYDDAHHGHAEVEFKNVRVPLSNVLLGEGRGFEIAQGRLGPGRIHHCMRLIGLSERALELMKDRIQSREAFGRPIARFHTVAADVANSRCEIDQARLLTLSAAHAMDTVGNKQAKNLIAMIKVVAPSMALRVIDRALQAHGGAGVSSDFPLAFMWAQARTLRFADGPDEVHRMQLARMEMNLRGRL